MKATSYLGKLNVFGTRETTNLAILHLLSADNYKLSFAGIIGEGYFCSSRFDDPVVELVKMLVPATRVLWQQTKVMCTLINQFE